MNSAILTPPQMKAPNEPGPAQVLIALAANYAATDKSNAWRKRFQLARAIRGIEKGLTNGKKLEQRYVKFVFDEWLRLSQQHLDQDKTYDDHYTRFEAELDKVRVPAGSKSDILNEAIDLVLKLQPNELPEIPDVPDAPMSWRLVAALHREMSRLSGSGEYYLSHRSAARVCQGVSLSTVHAIAGALSRHGVIEIISRGRAGEKGKASVFRYLLPIEDQEIEL